VGLRIGNVAAHNTYLVVLVEEGLIGLLIFLSLFVVLFFRLLPLPTFERRVGLIQLATLAVVLMPLSWQHHKGTWLTMALIAAWSSALAFPKPADASARPVPQPRPLHIRPRVGVR
jgi:O-antigen ligase